VQLYDRTALPTTESPSVHVLLDESEARYCTIGRIINHIGAFSGTTPENRIDLINSL
jgi:hypothetical protein